VRSNVLSKTTPDYFLEEEYAFCRQDLSAFIEKSFKITNPGTDYHHNWHIDCIAEYLKACETREIRRLIINIPPRNLKSICVSVAWPAWLLGQNPALKIMAASYSGLLSVKHSVDCRLLIESDWYRGCFPKTVIADDQNQKSKYITTARGMRLATSVGGTATGEGGNFLIVDDPHSAQEAQSKVLREGAINWFDTSYITRLNDKKRDVVVVIMQRLHEMDLTGHLLKQGGWEHLCIPSMAEKTTTYSIGSFKKVFLKDELLHPERENSDVLQELRKQMGSYNFAGQYMQRPAPAGGGIFKRDWIKLYPHNKPLPKFECIIQSYDTGLTEKTSSDPTAFIAWGIFSVGENKFAAMMIDAWDEALEYPELRKRGKSEYHTRYGEGDGRRADFALIESKGSGISLIQDMQRSGIPVRAYNPGRADKLQRAHLVTYLFEAGLVYVPESDKFKGKPYGWAERVIEQLISFPNAEHDDYVDATTQALRFLRDASWLKLDNDPREDREDPPSRINPYTR
jgi:predicted phage terminase large subunit-like protein